MSRETKGWLVIIAVVAALVFFGVRGGDSWGADGGDAACNANTYNC